MAHLSFSKHTVPGFEHYRYALSQKSLKRDNFLHISSCFIPSIFDSDLKLFSSIRPSPFSKLFLFFVSLFKVNIHPSILIPLDKKGAIYKLIYICIL